MLRPVLPRVTILVLNWNSWRDTIECLESVFRIDTPGIRVVICDNASTDGSPLKLRAWAAGQLESAPRSTDPRLRALTVPPVPKPIPIVECAVEEVLTGGGAAHDGARLVLIHTGANRGFAGGCNVGIRYALVRDDFDFLWILNNDTVVDPHALSAMLTRMAAAPGAGICGSTLLLYDTPDTVQTLGGATYDRVLGIVRHIGADRNREAPRPTEREVESAMRYVVGASMLVSKVFLRDVGLMSEEYFLYYEELDWAVRARGRYTLCVALDSIVYHKEGGSIGTSSVPGRGSITSDYYRTVNRIRFTRRHDPWLLPFALAAVFGALLNRLRRGQWRRAVMIAAILVGADSGPPRMEHEVANP